MKSWVARIAVGLLIATTACRKPEKPWKLPEQTGGRLIEANTGPEYDTVVFVNLEMGAVHSVLRSLWDLVLKPSGSSYEIWLNGAMYAFAAEVGEAQWHSLSAPLRELPWRCDLADTAALPALRQGERRYFILDRDRGEVFYRQPSQRYRKVLISWQGSEIQITATPLGGGDTARWRFPVGNVPLFVSLSKPDDTVAVLPSWRADLIVTRYVHPFYDQPEEFRWYPVVGVLLGEGIEAATVSADSVPYEAMDYAKAGMLSFTTRRDVIGYDWKRYNFSTGTYTIDTRRYFVLRLNALTYYKLRIIDFYDSRGVKGSVRIEYEPM
ncbi:MAG: HmuY family protein [Bacteroidia bacterium]|nr:HmuY family protein [Bacteroidia bacterium]MDW8058175.1 HmuY family protein [Bacteroidia bacterium]